MSNIFKAFAPITKVDDEQRMVYGYASTDSKDSQGEIVKSDAIEAALPDYMRFANIREMHTMSAVGVAKSAEVNEGGLYIGAKVVDDAAWIKVKEGVYKGFSIGGKALEKANGIISKLRLTEISLVDRPANPECVIDTWKAEGADEQDQDGGAPSAGAGDTQPTPDVVKADKLASIFKADGFVSYDEGKPIWDASRALSAMGQIFDLLCSESYELEKEPEQQASLRMAIDSLKAFVIAELQERVENGQQVAMADGAADDLAKAGATYSKSTAAKLKQVHDMIKACDNTMKGMGYDTTAKAEDGTDIAKAEALAKAESDLAKAQEANAELTKRVTELEAQPAPAKAAVTAIGKADDTKDGIATGGPAQPDPNDPLSMFKAALSRPLSVVSGQPISQPSSVN